MQDQQKNENTTFDSTDSRIFKTTTKSSFAKYIYCHVENYERGVLTTEEGKYGGSDKYTIQISTTDKDLSLVFDAHTDQAIHTLQIPKALESYKDQLYLTSSSTLSTAQVTADDLSKTWIPIYKKTGDDVWTQVYTSNQLKQAAAAAAGTGTYPVVLDAATFETIYDINSTTGELIMYNETAEPITTTIEVFACSLTENKDSTYSLSVVSLGQKQIILGQNNQFEYNNKTYSGLIAIDGTATTTNLTALTNGQFWHNYHQDSANAYLFEQAAVIETQLQTYWDQAYTASKYCKYFLPESWQPYDDQTTNTFTKDILVVDEQNRVSLSAKYLPAVEIYTDAANESTLSMFVNKHYLPKYDWELVSAVSQTSTLNSTYNENVLAEHEESNYINPAVTPLIVNNRAIQDVMSHLGSSLDKWRVIKNGYMTYYYAVGGGML